jgi:hypothetical protein
MPKPNDDDEIFSILSDLARKHGFDEPPVPPKPPAPFWSREGWSEMLPIVKPMMFGYFGAFFAYSIGTWLAGSQSINFWVEIPVAMLTGGYFAWRADRAIETA